ncbi:hypothetical protein [Nonomuraea sp. NPDC003754]
MCENDQGEDPLAVLRRRIDRLYRIDAGRPSYAALERYADEIRKEGPGDDAWRPLPRATLGDLVTGKHRRLPSWPLIRTFVLACHQAATVTGLPVAEAGDLIQEFVGLWRAAAERPAGGDVLAPAPAETPAHSETHASGERPASRERLAHREGPAAGERLAPGERSAHGERLAPGERSAHGERLAPGGRPALGERLAPGEGPAPGEARTSARGGAPASGGSSALGKSSASGGSPSFGKAPGESSALGKTSVPGEAPVGALGPAAHRMPASYGAVGLELLDSAREGNAGAAYEVAVLLACEAAKGDRDSEVWLEAATHWLRRATGRVAEAAELRLRGVKLAKAALALAVERKAEGEPSALIFFLAAMQAEAAVPGLRLDVSEALFS